jgi:hypothetical protein
MRPKKSRLLAKVKPVIRSQHKAGQPMQKIADELNASGVKTSQGKPWTAANVSRIAVQELGLRRTKSHNRIGASAEPKVERAANQALPWTCLLELLNSDLPDTSKKHLAKLLVDRL